MAKRKQKVYDQGLHHHRTLEDHYQALREKAFAEMWQEEAPSILSAIFVPRSRARNPFSHPLFSGRSIIKPDRLHRAMIATVVQWFGSNVGFSILEQTLKKCGYTIIRTETLDKAREKLQELKHAQKQQK